MNTGKWSEIQYLWPASQRGPSNSDTNFVCKIFPNGTVLGSSRRHTTEDTNVTQKGTNVLYFVTATMWNDTSTYVEHYNESIFPQWSYRGNEDPFIFNDINDNYNFKDHKIYLYCRSGNRSGIALEILKNLGYKDLVNAGGIKEASSLLKKEIIK